MAMRRTAAQARHGFRFAQGVALGFTGRNDSRDRPG